MKFKHNLFVNPFKSKIIFLKNNKFTYIYIYNSIFYFIGKSNKKNNTLSFSKNLFNILLLKQNINNLEVNFCLKKLSNLICSWDHYFFLKIKFKGKIYRIKNLKNRNIKLDFGKAHRVLLNYRHFFFKKRSKYKILFKHLSSKKLKNLETTIVKTRQAHLFTKRGLRSGRQVILKKVGKKSAYADK